MVRRIVAKFDDVLMQADVERWLGEKMEAESNKEALHEVIRDAIDNSVSTISDDVAREVSRAIERREKASAGPMLEVKA